MNNLAIVEFTLHKIFSVFKIFDLGNLRSLKSSISLQNEVF